MSRNFIGSKIAIITKSQIRYVGTIIGIDAQTSSVLLGNVKCFGTENRSGHLSNHQVTNTILPIMQFANSEIEDLKIFDEESILEIPANQQQQTYRMSAPSSALSTPASFQQPSIHDDPAIVSAVRSSTISSQLTHHIQQMSLSDEKPKIQAKNEESRSHSNSGEFGSFWPSSSQSNWGNNTNSNSMPMSQQLSNKKNNFFDQFTSDNDKNTNTNANSTQTLRENIVRHNGQNNDDGLPVRQPFFSDDTSYPQMEQLQPNRYQNDNMQYRQRHFHNNYNNNRSQKPHQQRYGGGRMSGNRETFQGNPDDYDDEFDFETSNLKFNKLTSEEELKHDNDLTAANYSAQLKADENLMDVHPTVYDKKKSFFDNLTPTEQSDTSTSYGYNRSKNRDTFNHSGYQQYNNRSNSNTYRRPTNNNNNQYRQNQYGNEDFHYKQHSNNKNGYNYRY